MIIDYSGGTVPGEVGYFEKWGTSGLLDGWLDDGGLPLIGDFLGFGRHQVMFINRRHASGGKVMIVDYSRKKVPGEVHYLEKWGHSGLLDGWLGDGQPRLVGDFLGLGRDQVMFINHRRPSGGKVMIVDYSSGEPGQLYWETWGENGLLDGWIGDGQLQFVGDFIGSDHQQVMYINRHGSDGGKVMIVDYSTRRVPGQVSYWERWGESGLLNGWLDDSQLHLVGDFCDLGRSQVMHGNRRRHSGGKVMIVDYSARTAPGDVRYWENWGQCGLLNGWIDY